MNTITSAKKLRNFPGTFSLKPRTYGTSCRGMTLLEALIAISIFTMTMLAIISSIQYFYRTNTYAIEQASAVSSAQRGVEDIVKTVREAAYASNGAYPIVSLGANDLTFYADVDSDPYIERVRYYVSGASLYRAVTDPSGDPPTYGTASTTSLISETVRNVDQNVATFQYYDMNGVLMTNYADIADVRFVSMNIVVNVDPNRLPNQLILRSTAAMRNLK